MTEVLAEFSVAFITVALGCGLIGFAVGVWVGRSQ